MARKSVEDELDDLDLDDLDDIDEEADEEDEVEDDEEVEDEDEDDDDPDEAPKARKSKKSKKSKTAKAPRKEKVGIGTKEIAEEAGIEQRVLRQFLRSSEYQPRDEREGRYSWPSLRDPEVKEILKKIKGGAAAKMNKEKLAELKEKTQAKKSAGKKTSAKKSSKKKVSSKK